MLLKFNIYFHAIIDEVLFIFNILKKNLKSIVIYKCLCVLMNKSKFVHKQMYKYKNICIIYLIVTYVILYNCNISLCECMNFSSFHATYVFMFMFIEQKISTYLHMCANIHTM